MALKPENLGLSAEEVAKADALEIELDATLRKSFVPGKTCSINCGEGGVPERLVNELIRRYKTAGWTEVVYKRNSLCDYFFYFDQ